MATTKLSLKKRRLNFNGSELMPLVADGATWAGTIEDFAVFVGGKVPIPNDVAENARVAADAATRAQTAAAAAASSSAAIGDGTLPDVGDLTGNEQVVLGGLKGADTSAIAQFVASVFHALSANADGSVARTMLAKILEQPASVKDFGATGDGVTNDDDARAKAEAKFSAVYWPAGIYVLNQMPSLDKSFGPGVCMVNGVRVYLRPDPSPARSIYAEIFGLPIDGVGDGSPALQRAVNLSQLVGLPVELPPTGDSGIFLASTVTWRHGRNRDDAIEYRPRIIANHTRLYAGPGVTAIQILPRCLIEDRLTGMGNAHTEIRGSLIVNGSKGDDQSCAITYGSTGYWTDDYQWSVIDDILIEGFLPQNVVAIFNECRHIKPNKFVVRSGSVRFISSSPDAFCGDMIFDALEVTGTQLYPPIAFIANGGTAGHLAAIRGIRVKDLTVYGTGVVGVVSGYAQLGDIWIGNAQFDAPGSAANENAFELASIALGGSIFNVKLNECYMASYNGCPLYVHASGGGVVTSVEIDNLYLDSITISGAAPSNQGLNSCAFFQGTQGCAINGGQWVNVSGDGNSQFVNFDNAQQGSVCNVTSYDCKNIKYGVSVGNGSNNYVLTPNKFNVTTAAVNDYNTGSPNRITAPNLMV
ncbi:glycoside hydrolase family 55 protein [Burkholderia gladioli]|uniref:glycoside hydrolase family 55 protein n=1 Tax=Burkholderia gladioli TaxID=28095 RepID=UPI001C5E2748|nr:glycoside hydrolase family 55 protein [Burkholderia gladioli]MBW5285785.1 hypothetical protein [Burkholderia gladioli]